MSEEIFEPVIRFSPKYQRGRGLGLIFANLFRFLRAALSSGLNTGADLINGISQQKPIKEVLRDRSFQLVDNLKDIAAEKIKYKIRNMTGSGCHRQYRLHHKNRSQVKTNKRKPSLPKSKGIKRNRTLHCAHSKNIVYLIYSPEK